MRRKDEIVQSALESLVSDEVIEGYAYDHFKQSEAVAPPFAVYRRVAENNFSADGKVYLHGGGVDIELYTSTSDEMANIMIELELLLDAEEIFYNVTADTVYIESEDFYESIYEL